MGAHENGLSLLTQRRNQVSHFAAPDWIEPAHGLVEEYYFRIIDE
jgi:hypothetical protein